MGLAHMLNCPNCAEHISISKVKNTFKCPKCRTLLKSNFLWVLILLVVGWSIVVPPLAVYLISGECLESSTCYGLAEAGIGLIIFFPIVPFVLKVKLGKEDKEEE